ncbi:hypothetical protein BCR37DRAFT_384760, partial [Protomyces lactucae-debilis]
SLSSSHTRFAHLLSRDQPASFKWWIVTIALTALLLPLGVLVAGHVANVYLNKDLPPSAEVLAARNHTEIIQHKLEKLKGRQSFLLYAITPRLVVLVGQQLGEAINTLIKLFELELDDFRMVAYSQKFCRGRQVLIQIDISYVPYDCDADRE